MWICEPMKNIQCPCQIQTGNKQRYLHQSLNSCPKLYIPVKHIYNRKEKQRQSHIHIPCIQSSSSYIYIMSPEKALEQICKITKLAKWYIFCEWTCTFSSNYRKETRHKYNTCTECSRYRCECKLHSTPPKHFPAILFHIDKPYHSYHSHKPRKIEVEYKWHEKHHKIKSHITALNKSLNAKHHNRHEKKAYKPNEIILICKHIIAHGISHSHHNTEYVIQPSVLHFISAGMR